MAIVGARVGWQVAAAFVSAQWAFPAPAAAQADARQSLVTVSVTPESVTVGERFSVHVRVRAPKVATIRFPDVPQAAGGIDPVDPRAIEDGPAGEVLDRTAIYSFVAWDLGRRAPALGPVVVSVAGRERSFSLGEPAVIVRSLLPADTAEMIPREARPPIPLPSGMWRYALLGLVAAIGAYLYWRARRSRHRIAVASVVPDPWEEARCGFVAIGRLGLVEAGEPGRNVIAHVDVMRKYLARRFPAVTEALDATAASAALAALDNPAPMQRVAALLERDARLRFAHEPVGVDDSNALAAEARDLTALVQLAHEARMRALERPPRPRRR